MRYRGRFAPSPTGPLHFGSLVAALASWADARRAGGEWLVRVEDIDKPREVPGAADAILRGLEDFGLCWDGVVLRQSERTALYHEALERLKCAGQAFPCACSRKEIADSVLRPSAGGEVPYPGTCRGGMKPGRAPRSWRMQVAPVRIEFDDRVQGRVAQQLETEAGDFVLWRADGCFAYQLAVVVDDADQEITDVVRGADLLASTPRQIWLQQALGLPTPRYAHVPVAVNEHGEKLSKQTLAAPIEHTVSAEPLWRALHFLGQRPPAELRRAPSGDLLAWAREAWDLARVPMTRALAI
jgi:glutamyl-Q tRNA(Asp) synthetase